MKCPNCENSIEEKSVFCEWCEINLQTFEADQKAEVERLAEKRELAAQLRAKKQEKKAVVRSLVGLVEKIKFKNNHFSSKKKVIVWSLVASIVVSALIFAIIW